MSELEQPPPRERGKPMERALLLRDLVARRRSVGALLSTGAHMRLSRPEGVQIPPGRPLLPLCRIGRYRWVATKVLAATGFPFGANGTATRGSRSTREVTSSRSPRALSRRVERNMPPDDLDASQRKRQPRILPTIRR